MNFHNFLKEGYSRLVISSLLITVAAGAAVLSSKTFLGRSWEQSTIDLRFRINDSAKLSSEIVLLVEDSAAVAEFGELPSQRGLLAAFHNQLHRLGAKVVAIDFRFEEPNIASEDSLLIDEAETSDHFISGSYFPETSEKDYAALDSTGITPCEKCAVSHYPFFMSTPDTLLVLPMLREAGADIAHLNIMLDPVNNHSTSIPGFLEIEVNGVKELSSAFALEVVKKFYGVSNHEISIENQHIVLKPAGEDHVHVPMLNTGEFFINHLGPARLFQARSMGWSEFQTLVNSPDDSAAQKKLVREVRDKIVIIGSVVDENDSHYTPFAPEFGLPGVYLHANAVDNILRRQFVTFASTRVQIFLFIFIGCGLLWIFSRPGPLAQISGVVLLTALYLVTAFVFFKFERSVLPVTPVGVFVLLAALLHGCKEWIFSAREQDRLKELVAGQEASIPEEIRTLGRTLANQSYYVLVIFAIEERDSCWYSHWIDLRRSGPAQPFMVKIRPPLQVSMNVARKLNHDLEAVWKAYFHHLLHKENPDPSPLSMLQKIGSRIKDHFGVRAGFDGLFSEFDASLPLQIVTPNLKAPWPLAYHADSGVFLCEKFSIGVSFTSEKRFEQEKEILQAPDNPNHRMAILFYGDWNGHAGKELLTVNDHVGDLQRQFVRRKCTTLAIKDSTQDFLHNLSRACEDKDNLRLIHYAGHALNGFLDVGERDFLKSGTISETAGIRFVSRPLVFLNACSSGKLPEEWDRMDHLCTEFLACGAGACIVTSFDVFEKTAGWFAGVFYEHFVDEGLPAGEALRRTINDLGKRDKVRGYDPEYDITRYFYYLFGDPTITF